MSTDTDELGWEIDEYEFEIEELHRKIARLEGECEQLKLVKERFTAAVCVRKCGHRVINLGSEMIDAVK